MLQSMSDSGAAKVALLREQNDMLDMLSLRFSPDSSYAVGDFCLYFNGTFDGLYQFTAAKGTGAWDGTKVKQVSLSSLLTSMKKEVEEIATEATSGKVSKTGDTMTGNLTISKTDPYIQLTSVAGGSNTLGIHYYGSADQNNTLGFYDNKKARHILTIAQSTGNATFVGTVSATNITTMQNTINAHTTSINNLSSSKQNNLGFTPVRQGGGAGQQGNVVYIGWSGDRMKCQVDATDMGCLMTNATSMFTWGYGVHWNDNNGAFIRSDGKQRLEFGGSGEEHYWIFEGVTSGVWAMCPYHDAMVTLGTGANRWGQVYSTGSAISTSDRSQKHDIEPIDDRYLQLFMKLKPVKYKYNYGTSNRTHTGFIAQDVYESMQEVGLTDLDFAAYCKDKQVVQGPVDPDKSEPYYEESTVIDEDGEEQIVKTLVYPQFEDKDVLDEDGNPVYLYSLRYEEFIPILTTIIQKHEEDIRKLKEEIEQLENKS